jgi:hypothetical protein
MSLNERLTNRVSFAEGYARCPGIANFFFVGHISAAFDLLESPLSLCRTGNGTPV